MDLVLMKTYIRMFRDETFVDLPLEACSAAIQVHDQGGRKEHVRRNRTPDSHRANPPHRVMTLDVPSRYKVVPAFPRILSEQLCGKTLLAHSPSHRGKSSSHE